MEPLKPLSSPAQREIETFADSIAGELGPEVQRELAAHVADKVQSLISGRESVSEADALLLARHHFGNTDAVRSLLEQSRALRGVDAAPWMLRLMTIFAGMLLAGTAQILISFAYGWICTHL